MMGHVRHIVIIQSLENERLTGTELYEDCIRRRIDLQGLPFTHAFYNVSNKDELVKLLQHYGAIARNYVDGIAIHFEMHGADNLKGLVLSNGQFIDWEELVDLFRALNIGTQNNLYITMGTCNGRYMYTGVDPYKKSPYAAFISASITVSSQQVADDFFRLYDNLLDNGNLIDSYLLMEQGGTEFYYKDSKTCFEEAFESTMEKLQGDRNLRAKIVEDARRQTLDITGTELTEAEANMVFSMALRDIFKRYYDAFKF